MALLLGYNDVKKQSNAVWGQFGESKWIPFAKENAKLPHGDCRELRLSGLGKYCVLAAMGESLEPSIPILKKYRNKFDIVTCDKGFGVLLEHGIKADYVQICDCNIPYRWLEPYVNETEGVKLLATCYANTEWTTAWKGRKYFYVNRDAINTHEKFMPIMGPGTRTIPAGSNVSNAMLIFMVGIDERAQANWAGYESYILTGYDYSWRPRGPEMKCKTGNYYAFNDPDPKRYYMSHRTLLDCNNDVVNTSENLLFSAKWLYSYVTIYGLPVINCSGRGILDIPHRGDLEKVLSGIQVTPERISRVRRAFNTLSRATEVTAAAEAEFKEARGVLCQ